MTIVAADTVARMAVMVGDFGIINIIAIVFTLDHHRCFEMSLSHQCRSSHSCLFDPFVRECKRHV